MQNTLSDGQRVEDNNAKPLESMPQSMNSDISLQKQSYFKNIQINAINGNSTVTITGSQQQTQFEIPICCWNPYWTVLSFTVTPPTVSAGSYQKIPTNYCPWFNRIELYTASGNVYLVNVQQADFYSALACPINNDYKEIAEESGFCTQSRRNIFGKYVTAGTDPNLSDPIPVLLNDNATINGLVPVSAFNYGAGIYSAAAPGVIPTYTYSISLRKLLGDSFFNQNNSFWLSKVVYLRLTWNPVSNIVYAQTQSNANPSVITLAEYTSLVAPTVIVAGQVNLQINIEGDESCINAKKMLTEQPSTVVIPYIYNWSQSQNGNGTLQTSFTLASDGSKIFRLYKLFSGLARSVAGLKVCFSNWAGAAGGYTDNAGVFNRVFLYINGIMIKNYNLDPQAYNMLVSDFANNFPKSSLKTTQSILAYGGIAQQFTTDQVESDINEYSNMVAKGLDASKTNLAINIQYQMVTGIGAAQLYLFPIVCKSFEYVAGSFNYQ